ncbi:MAG: hypothetical protein D6693_11135 [Planctomycetota bacterium]|nr:MAG: hypothetical protein D6693_11135 [Planctomycetota bacterium]
MSLATATLLAPGAARVSDARAGAGGSAVRRSVTPGASFSLDADRLTVPTDADARDAAEEFVAVAFIEPVLRSLRESNHAPAPFGPTAAEKSFGPLLDAQIARGIVARERYGLVDAVARGLRSGTPGADAAPTELDTRA